MSVDIEKYILTAKDWAQLVDETSAHKEEERVKLLNSGFRCFFAIVDELPGINEQSPKPWSDYREEDIDFIVHDGAQVSSKDERALRIRISDSLGFDPYVPLRIGVFGVCYDKLQASRGNHIRSANLDIESLRGQIFRRRVVLHLNYQHISVPDWSKGLLSYDLYRIEGEQLEKVQKASKMDLLLTANSAAVLFAKEFAKLQQTVPSAP